jgi:nitrogen fixation/metabolism regulation signal transduction histidine kinase
MAYSRFQAATFLRLAGLIGTLMALVWAVSHTDWYVCMLLLALASVVQSMLLVQHANRSSREVARFLDAIAFDDASASFQGLSREGPFAELGAAMTQVLDRLRTGRAEREEQTQYLQTLLAHMPVALISLEDRGKVQLLNMAARRLFESACTDTAQFSRHGDAFAIGMETLKPGESVIVRMERQAGPLQLKAAATDMALEGSRRRLVSLQNIESELTAHELAAWQTVIRVMAHEVMNSLTPISSLAATARDRVEEVLEHVPADDPRRAALEDAEEALEAMARRSEGLLHFVQNHRRLTKRMVVSVEVVPVRRIFARLQRLLAGELALRHIQLVMTVVPDTLEVAVDAELLDQALINLVRNSMEAFREESGGRITVSARMEMGGRAVIAVADNGHGIPPEQREKIFVPFFTTKRQGSGIGLTLVRQIATVHGATVAIADTPGGGTTVSLNF